jgi:nucleotide-binding universal stress UspA family protein
MMPSATTVATGSQSIKTIVVATDFSECAAAALDWAIELAKLHKAHVVIVHAVETDLPALAVPPHPYGERLQEWLLESRTRVLAASGIGATVESHIDKPWKVVPTVAARVKADVIVLGARGKTNLAGKLLGSTADRIIRTTSVPVVVIRGEVKPLNDIHTALVAYDFSEESARALSTTVKLLSAAPHPIRLVLLRVIPLEIVGPDPTLPLHLTVPPPPSFAPAFWLQVDQHAAEYLETIAAQFRSDQWTVDVKTAHGFPSQEILNEAQAIGAQLIAVGTHGRGGLNRFFIGSVAEWVLHHATCPVLTVRKPDQTDFIALSAVT